MYRPHWIPESQPWSVPPTSTPAATPTSSRTPPSLSGSGVHPPGTPPKDMGAPTHEPASSSSAASTVSTKLEAAGNYESLNNHQQPPNAPDEAGVTKDVKAEDLKPPAPLQNYQDYYSYHSSMSNSAHNDLSSALVNCNSVGSTAASSLVRSPQNAQPPRPNSSKSNKNRPNAGKPQAVLFLYHFYVLTMYIFSSTLLNVCL